MSDSDFSSNKRRYVNISGRENNADVGAMGATKAPTADENFVPFYVAKKRQVHTLDECRLVFPPCPPYKIVSLNVYAN